MRKWLAVFLVPCALLTAEVEDSIVDQLDHFEQIGNLERKKYASGQWEEIVEALSRVDERVRVMSYNMLMDVYEPQLARKDRWVNRRSRVAELIRHDLPDLICSQELQAGQIDDLIGLIGDDYLFYGVGELDGKGRGQHNGFFYLPQRLELVEGKTLWMSETPERVSRSPVDPKPRQLTVCHFHDRQTGKEFVAMNTHLRYNNPDSRAYCARFIGKLASTYAIPVVVAGDMNTFPNRPDLQVLPFYDGDYIQHLLTEGVLTDSSNLAAAGSLGPISTFTVDPDDPYARPFRGTGRPGVILDHIYVTDDITVLMHAVEPARVDGHFPSDHLPVIADIIL